MSDAKAPLEQPGVGCMDSSHLDPDKTKLHTDGHCVPCCEAISLFGKGSPRAQTVAQQHVRHLNTA